MYQQTCYTGVTHPLQGVENVCWRHLHVMCLALEKVQVVGTLDFMFSSHILRGMGVTFQGFQCLGYYTKKILILVDASKFGAWLPLFAGLEGLGVLLQLILYYFLHCTNSVPN